MMFAFGSCNVHSRSRTVSMESPAIESCPMADDELPSDQDESDPLDRTLPDEKTRQKETETETQPLGVDQGWAWLVMVAVFMIFFILDGLSCSFGILYVDFLSYFGSSKGETAMIGSLLYGVPLLVTPFCCGCIEILGFRKVTMIGGAVASLVFFLCIFANSVLFLTIAIGVVAAAFMALSYDAGLLCLSHYFDKRRGLATGIAMSSTGVGTFVFAPFIDYLLEAYAWRGCLLILSGLCMNVIACGAVFRPLTYPKTKHGHNNNNDETRRTRTMSTSLVDFREKDLVLNQSRSEADLNSYTKYSARFEHVTAAWTASLASIRDQPETETGKTSAEQQKPANSLNQIGREFTRVLKLCFDIKLFKNPKWVLFVVSNMLYCTSFGFPYIYIPHLAIVNGIEEDRAALLLSVLGIATTISLLASAAAADYTRHVVLVYACSMLCSGASLVIFPFISGHYLAMCAVTALFSVGVGANFAMGTLIIIDIVGLDDLVIAYGQMGFVQGISTTFGTPSGGWVFDAYGSYDMAFIGAGIVVLLSGIILLPLSFMDCRKRAKMSKLDLNEESATEELSM